jgi:hypothetical protein
MEIPESFQTLDTRCTRTRTAASPTKGCAMLSTGGLLHV